MRRSDLRSGPNVPDAPTITAVIALYNGAAYIQRALESILEQSQMPSEIIVVDDGSTDNGCEIVREVAEGRFPVRIIVKENGGQGSARNLGVKSSTGGLIAFLDQDDAWYPNHLEELLKPFLDNNPRLGWAYSDLDQVDADWHMVCHEFLQTMPTQHPKRDIVACLRQDMFILPSASLISREAFEAVGGFDERLSGYEDDDLFIRIFRQGYANVFINKALSAWRIHAGSTSYSPRMARSRAIYMQKLIELFPDDVDMNRYYRRDCIAPRFSTVFVSEYLRGLRRSNRKLIEASTSDLRRIVPYMRTTRRMAFRAALPLLSIYPVAKIAYQLRLHVAAMKMMGR